MNGFTRGLQRWEAERAAKDAITSYRRLVSENIGDTLDFDDDDIFELDVEIEKNAEFCFGKYATTLRFTERPQATTYLGRVLRALLRENDTIERFSPMRWLCCHTGQRERRLYGMAESRDAGETWDVRIAL